MSESVSELRRIDWKAVFPFTLIFRTFKMAIHPSTLALAFAMVLLTGIWGYALDMVTSRASWPVAGEVDAYWRVRDIEKWREEALLAQAALLNTRLRTSDVELDVDRSKLAERFVSEPAAVIDELSKKLEARYEQGVAEINEQFDKKEAGGEDAAGTEDGADEQPAGDGSADASESESTRDLEAERLEHLAMWGSQCNQLQQHLDHLKPEGIFESFLHYETDVAGRAVSAAATLNFVGGMDGLFDRQPSTVTEGEMHPTRLEDVGVLGCVVLAVRGKQWLAAEHPVFAVFFGIVALAIWALFGGAICRIAALYASRDERVPLMTAMRFAWRKFLNLFVVYLLPVGLIIVLGFVLFLGGALTSIPGIGWIFSLLTPLALAAGFLMAMVMIGAVAGGGMFFPAIAAEGSDGFDALSRSYSFVYTRPWHAGLYAVIAAVYGAICYLFVRFFTFLLLAATRATIGAGMGLASRPGVGDVNATKIDAIWPAPTFGELLTPLPAFGRVGFWTDGIPMFFVMLCVTLTILLLCAFLASFFYSGATVIYLLLRRDVDGIDIDDVYLDEGDETAGYFDTSSFAEPATAAAVPPVQEETTSEPPETPAPETPAEQVEEDEKPPAAQADEPESSDTQQAEKAEEPQEPEETEKTEETDKAGKTGKGKTGGKGGKRTGGRRSASDKTDDDDSNEDETSGT